MGGEKAPGGALKRDLGTLESYAVLIGILVGAGIFRVTSDATAATGPSVILAHLVLAPVILATAVAYMVFLSTPLGLRPGGEVLHIARTLGSPRLTFLASWLKLIAYVGAGAYLADALAINLLELVRPGVDYGRLPTVLVGIAALWALFTVNSLGVRWFGRLQVAMCGILALSLAVLILPGLFAVEKENYRPFFTNGARGFGVALPSLFFAYAGFEALAQAAGEVEDSRRRLPRIFLRGILATSAIFVFMSIVALGVLPSDELGASGVPMSRAAATYLPFGAEFVVTLGAIMAVATSLNATIFVPARLTYHLAREGYVPPIFAEVHATRGTPVPALLLTFVSMLVLLISGRMGLALGIAVVSLMLLYLAHSAALILLPRRSPDLFSEVETRIPRWIQLAAAWLSALALGALVLLQFGRDADRIAAAPFAARVRELDLTSLELLVLWVALGLLLFRFSGDRGGAPEPPG